MIELTEVRYQGAANDRPVVRERPLLVNPLHVVSVNPTGALPEYPDPVYRLVMVTGDSYLILDPTHSEVGIEGIQRALSREAA